jgi:hypothetical protein
LNALPLRRDEDLHPVANGWSPRDVFDNTSRGVTALRGGASVADAVAAVVGGAK